MCEKDVSPSPPFLTHGGQAVYLIKTFSLAWEVKRFSAPFLGNFLRGLRPCPGWARSAGRGRALLRMPCVPGRGGILGTALLSPGTRGVRA